MNEPQFRHLLDKYRRGECTPDEVGLLHRFYDSFQENEASASADGFERERVRRHIQQRIRRRSRTRGRSVTRRWRRAAASVLLLLGLGIGGYLAYTYLPTREVAWKARTTQKGQRATLTLTDGTRIHLNADSRLSFPERFAADRRTVVLEGEAFFEVAHQPQRPFVITSGELTTTVLGTSFNVRAFAGETSQVTVATGQVNVRSADRSGNTQEVTLNPYEQASYDGQLSTREVDVRPFVDWQEKVLRFREVSLTEAVIALERWYNVSIRIEDERIRACTISGAYINERLTNVLESFEHILNIKYRITEDQEVVLTGTGCSS